MSNKFGSRGVSWHSGAGKFMARIVEDGRRVSLGYFATAEEASEAYASRRELRAQGASNVSLLRAAMARGARPGEALRLPDGQVYELARVEQRVSGRGNVFPVYHWRSSCRECGAAFETATLRTARGLVRTCEAHRGAAPLSRPRRSPRKPDEAPRATQAPETLERPPLIFLGAAVIGRLRAEAEAKGVGLGDLEEYRAIQAQAQRLGCSVREVAEHWDVV